MTEKVDMSLDDIIKMNRNKKFAKGANQNNKSAGKKFQVQRQKPDKLRGVQRRPQFKARANVTKNKRFSGNNRGQWNNDMQSSVNRARQTLRTAMLRKQQARKLNTNRRGVANVAGTQLAGSNQRKKLVRPGFGVLQSDILAQQLEQRKKQLAFKQAIEESQQRAAEQRQAAQKQRHQSMQIRQQAAASAVSTYNNRQWSVAGRTVATAARGGGVSSVRIQVTNTGRTPGSTNPATANRILQHSIKQTLRERPVGQQRQQSKARRNARRRIGANYGTVRIFTNMMTDLQKNQNQQNRLNNQGRMANRIGVSNRVNAHNRIQKRGGAPGRRNNRNNRVQQQQGGRSVLW